MWRVRGISLWAALSVLPIPQKTIRSCENWVRLLEQEVVLGQWLVLPGMGSSLPSPATAAVPEKNNTNIILIIRIIVRIIHFKIIHTTFKKTSGDSPCGCSGAQRPDLKAEFPLQGSRHPAIFLLPVGYNTSCTQKRCPSLGALSALGVGFGGGGAGRGGTVCAEPVAAV